MTAWATKCFCAGESLNLSTDKEWSRLMKKEFKISIISFLESECKQKVKELWSAAEKQSYYS